MVKKKQKRGVSESWAMAVLIVLRWVYYRRWAYGNALTRVVHTASSSFLFDSESSILTVSMMRRLLSQVCSGLLGHHFQCCQANLLFTHWQLEAPAVVV